MCEVHILQICRVSLIYTILEQLQYFVLLSGSGKSYLAKMLRDLEVENSGSAPRIHSMDDYFMTEVERVLICLLISHAPSGPFDLSAGKEVLIEK